MELVLISVETEQELVGVPRIMRAGFGPGLKEGERGL